MHLVYVRLCSADSQMYFQLSLSLSNLDVWIFVNLVLSEYLPSDTWQVGPDAFEQAAAGGGAGPGGPFGGAGFGNPFEDVFGGGSRFNDVCTLLQSDLSVCLLNVERWLFWLHLLLYAW